MSRLPLLLALIGFFLLVAACDAVRYPGDGGEPPRAPPSAGDGQPGPPPPATPVADTYDGEADGAGEDGSDVISADPGEGDPPAPATPPGSAEPDDPLAPPPPDDTTGDDGTVPGSDGAGSGAAIPPEPVFSYFPPGRLLPGSGTGAFEQIVHAPDMVFPIRSAPAYLQSQVWSFGGGVAGGDQCDSRNYSYPWRDNFCETRTAERSTPFCPLSRVHLGQDIRVGTPEDCRQLRATDAAGRTLHEVVAVEDGVIYDIATYTVKLRSGGRIYRYMHLNMAELQVQEGDAVEAGDIIGYVSNDFGGTPTTFHLHFEIIQNTEAHGWEHVPPFLSLVEAYERRENGFGDELPVEAASASSRILPVPDGLEIIE